MKNKKTYVLIVSINFPKTHKRAGAPTGFPTSIIFEIKKHTLRKNYPLWKKRVDEINAGRAVLSVRYWEGLPYRSKQCEFIEFSRLGIQKLQYKHFNYNENHHFLIDDLESPLRMPELAINDGLLLDDFQEWFKPMPTEPMAIIHFTDNFTYPVADPFMQRKIEECRAGKHIKRKWVSTGEDSGRLDHEETANAEECIFCNGKYIYLSES